MKNFHEKFSENAYKKSAYIFLKALPFFRRFPAPRPIPHRILGAVVARHIPGWAMIALTFCGRLPAPGLALAYHFFMKALS
jgi:hypothetical protein